MPQFFEYDSNRHGIQIERVKKANTTNSAIASLNIALKSYFSTHEFFERLSPLTDEGKLAEREERFLGSLTYQEKYLQTIFHFHHFFELLFKDELRAINPILAVRLETNSASYILDLIDGTNRKPEKNTVEFSAALSRLKSLYTSNIKIAEVVRKYEQVFKDLNTLRNKSWHRGTYVLRYKELDQFISANILPCTLECIEHSNYKDTETYWKYKNLVNEIDPIKELISSIRKVDVDFAEIAFYKAMGAAAYNIPDRNWDLFGDSEAAVKNAEALLEYDGEDILNCFVCGNPTLVTYKVDDMDTDEKGNVTEAWWTIYKIKCEACNLKLYRGIGEPSKYGIDIPQVWKGEVY